MIGVAWQPSLASNLNHFTRWLQFRTLPLELRWITAVLGAAVAVPIVLRLISLARIARYHMSRARRLALVMLHLLPAPMAWVAATSAIRGGVEVEACVMACVPILVVLAVSWIGYPAPMTHPIAPTRGRVFIHLITYGVLIWAAFWLAGRPLPEDRAGAVQWGRAGSYNNIRPWMEPLRAPWVPSTPISPDLSDLN